MKKDLLKEYVTRKRVLELLSDTEAAQVGSAEAGNQLREGEEYLDVEHVVQGVQWAVAGARPLGRVIQRSAVHAGTWSQILALLDEAAPAR